MKLNLPLHPSRRHPLTGEALRAIALHPKTGDPVWPIMGGDDTVPPKQDDPPKDEPPKQDPPKEEKPEGFPANTPVAEMTVEQKAAYWQHQSRKHEERATEYRTAAGGKTAAEIKAELESADTLKREKLSEQERAVEDAKREARESTASEYGTKAVRMAFELALRALPKQDRKEFIEDLDLSRFLTDSGDVDTAKVLTRAEKIAPADKGTGRHQFDFGAGKRGDGGSKPSVSAGAALFDASRGKSTQTTT